jgi:hypothetical protein
VIGRGLLGIWMEVDPAGLDDFNAWYRRQHVPERLSVPGFLRGRRWEALEALYETAEARDPLERALPRRRTPLLALCTPPAAAGAERAGEFWRAWAARTGARVTLDGYRLMYGLAWLEP